MSEIPQEAVSAAVVDLPAAKPDCEHYWAYHLRDGLSVRLCQLCHEPDWADVRAELKAAAAAERERIRALITERAEEDPGYVHQERNAAFVDGMRHAADLIGGES